MNSQKSLSVKLTKTTKEKKWGDESLGDLIEKAVRVLNDGEAGDHTSMRQWLIRNALRSVCKAVIREQCCYAPMEVAFIGAEPPPSNVVPFQHQRN